MQIRSAQFYGCQAKMGKLKLFKLNFSKLFFLVIFFSYGNECLGFFTTVEYPGTSLSDLRRKQVAVTTEGELIVLKTDEPPSQNEYGNTFIMISWKRFLTEQWAMASKVDFLIRTASLRCLDQIDPFEIMLFIVENLCFLVEMHAWKKVLFIKSQTEPTLYDDQMFGGHQRLCIILESARFYCAVASLIEQSSIDRRLPYFLAKPYLMVWGYTFLLDQAMKFYKKYFNQVSDHLARVSKNKNAHLMTLQLSLNMGDAQNFRRILADEELSKLTLFEKQTIAGVIDDIERISCPQQPTQKLPQQQTQPGQQHSMEQGTCVPQSFIPKRNYFSQEKETSLISKILTFLPLLKRIFGIP